MVTYRQKVIAVKDIDRVTPYRCRYTLRDRALKQSVLRRGILTPVVLTSGLQIVAGHKRVALARELGLDKVQSFCLHDSLKEEDLFLSALLSNWKQRLSELDHAWILRVATQEFRLEEVVMREEVLPCLGLRPDLGSALRQARVLDLESEVLDLIAEGSLPFRGAVTLFCFSPEEQRLFVREIASKVHFSSSQLAQAGEWLSDLIKRRGTGLSEVLYSSGLQTILQQDPSEKPLKSKKFLSALRALRFPQLVDKERRFASCSREIAKNHEIELEAPHAFEDEGFLLKARIRRPEALDRVLEVMKRKRRALNSLFDIML